MTNPFQQQNPFEQTQQNNTESPVDNPFVQHNPFQQQALPVNEPMPQQQAADPVTAFTAILPQQAPAAPEQTAPEPVAPVQELIVEDVAPEIKPVQQSLDTSIVKITTNQGIAVTSEFQKVLNEIPKLVDEVDHMLADYRANPAQFLENTDEADIDQTIKNMTEYNNFIKQINTSRKDIKKHMDGIRDNVLSVLDNRLNEAKFDKLETAQSDMKQLKKDLETERLTKRWGELKPTFDANINRYPLLQEHAAKLTDFSNFKIMNPKLVSGAKTRTIKEADHTFINETLFAWNTGIELIMNNEWGLDPYDSNKLLQMFLSNPKIDMVQTEGRNLRTNADMKQQAKEEAERRQKEQEEAQRKAQLEHQAKMEEIQRKEALAKQQRDMEAQRQAELDRQLLEQKAKQLAEQEQQRQQELLEFSQRHNKAIKESYPLFIEYLFSQPQYHNVHNNDFVKASIILDISQQMNQPDSVVVRETQYDPQAFMALVRYIAEM